MNVVRDEVDKQILRRLADRLAREQLDAAEDRDAGGGSVELPAYPVSLPPPVSRWVAECETGYVLSGHPGEELPAPPLQEMNSVIWNADEIKLLCSSDRVPCGVVLLEVAEAAGSQRTLGCKILALPEFRDNSAAYRASATPFREIAGDADPHAVTVRPVPATPDCLPLFRRYLPEIRQLLNDPVVACDERLKQDVEKLCADLQNLPPEKLPPKLPTEKFRPKSCRPNKVILMSGPSQEFVNFVHAGHTVLRRCAASASGPSRAWAARCREQSAARGRRRGSSRHSTSSVPRRTTSIGLASCGSADTTRIRTPVEGPVPLPPGRLCRPASR